MRPLVSVVIPTHNRRQFLPEALESAFAQTYSPIEILVVDDGSTDGTDEVIQRFIPPVRYFRQENKGAGAARNLGLVHAEGEYVAFLDSDDRWLPEKVEAQMELALAEPDVGLVGCGELCVREDGEVFFEGWAPREVPLSELELRCQAFGGASRALIPRPVLDEVGHFDETLKVSQDWDLWLRIAKRYRVRNVPRPLTRWRQHFNPRPDRDISTRLENTYRLLNRHIDNRKRRRQALSHFHFRVAREAIRNDGLRIRSLKHLATSFVYSPRRVNRHQKRGLIFLETVVSPDFLTRLARLKSKVRGRG